MTREMLEDNLRVARAKLSDVGRHVAAFVRERPGTALLAAVGAGYLVGRLLRR